MVTHGIPNFDVNIINQEHQGGHEWLGNETNAKISDGQAKVFFSAITHKVFMSTYEWRLFINIPIRNVCVDSVQLC